MVRNLPEWATIEDRELTVARALQENGLGHIDWDLTTTQMEGSKGVFLAPISILTVPTYTARKKIMEACSRAVVRYWHKNVEEKTPAESETQTGEDTTDRATKEATDAGQASSSQEAKPSQAVWEVKTWNWNNPVKMAPGITQFERRLGAPMHGLITLPKVQEGVADPKVEDLDLGGFGGSLVGGVLYSRKQRSLTGTVGTASDWSCEVQLPACRDVWCDQLKQQVEHTEVERQAFASASQKTSQDYVAAACLNRFLTKAVPSYTDGEEEGIEHWLARFKFEYPSELSFTGLSQDHSDRMFFQDIRPVEELMEEMAATKAAEAEVKPGPGDTLGSEFVCSMFAHLPQLSRER